MNDAINETFVLDTERPWIKDQRDLPSQQNWLADMFDPFGKSSKLHYSRVWTLCFLTFVIFAIAPPILFSIVGMGGLTISSSVWAGWSGALGIVYLLTLVPSFIVHIRRLNDAKKSPLLAIIIMAPLLLSGALFVASLSDPASRFDAAIEKQIVSMEKNDKIVTKIPVRDQAIAKVLDIRLSKFIRMDDAVKERTIRNGQKKLTMESARGSALGLCALLSLFVLLWQTLWVFKLPQGEETIINRSDLP